MMKEILCLFPLILMFLLSHYVFRWTLVAVEGLGGGWRRCPRVGVPLENGKGS